MRSCMFNLMVQNLLCCHWYTRLIWLHSISSGVALASSLVSLIDIPRLVLKSEIWKKTCEPTTGTIVLEVRLCQLLVRMSSSIDFSSEYVT